MKIIAVETNWTRIPLRHGRTAGTDRRPQLAVDEHRVAAYRHRPGAGRMGGAFGHASAATTKTMMDTQLAPAILGQDARDIGGLRARLSKAFPRVRPQRGRTRSRCLRSTSACGTSPQGGQACRYGACSVQRRQRSSPAMPACWRYGDAPCSRLLRTCEVARGYRGIKAARDQPSPRCASRVGHRARRPPDGRYDCPWT